MALFGQDRPAENGVRIGEQSCCAIAATGASLAAFSLFFQLSTQTGALRDGSPLLAGPYEPVAWLGVQVAIAVGALTGCDGGGTGATR